MFIRQVHFISIFWHEQALISSTRTHKALERFILLYLGISLITLCSFAASLCATSTTGHFSQSLIEAVYLL